MMQNWLKKASSGATGGGGSGGGGGGGGGAPAAPAAGAVILPAAIAARLALQVREREARVHLTRLLELTERTAGRPTAERL